MKRRTLIAGLGAASLARPALVRAAAATTLRLIPQIDLSFLDPHWTTAYVTRNHGYMVFDTLYGLDATSTPQPQMVEGHTVEDDGKLWTLTLRPGLMWHDGTPVLSRDCAASIRRWAKRDAMGDALMAATDELSTPDDRTLRFRLKHPFPLLPAALGKAASPMPAMMPERLANTDAFTQITEMTGSGPFRFVASERVVGSRNVYAKNDKYVPREGGTVSWTAGPKIVHFDRVEWTTVPDAATAANALLAGEHDWLEYPALDLLDLLKRNRSIRVTMPDPTGLVEMMRPNHLQPPFNNPAIRRAVLHAIDQAKFMQAITADPALSHTPLGFFGPGTPMASEVGLERLKPPIDLDRARAELKAAGYNGERVVLLVPTDYVTLKAMADVASDTMKSIGMNVDYVATDWGTMLQRRNSKQPVEAGGWSCFVTGWAGLDWSNPAGHIALRGNGEAGWPGWSSDAKLEALRQDWLVAPDVAKQKAICEDIQREAMDQVPYWPLGQYMQPTAFRTRLSGVNDGFATFWNVAPVS
jgi:peptide/nickel transport system substrate-binding protein